MRSTLSSVILSSLLFLSSCVTENEPDNTGVAVGDRLPEFTVSLSDGTTVTRASLTGKVAVIEFFNTSCPDCQDSFDVMQRLYDLSKDSDDIIVFAISRDEDLSSVAGYWHSHNLSIPFSPQPDRRIYNLFASTGIPRIYIADKAGIITAAYSPEDEPTLQELISAVEDAGGRATVDMGDFTGVETP